MSGAGQFVPDGFEAPRGLDAPGFRFEPLGPEHNDRDYAAWTSSIAHIRATPGFERSEWPHQMSPEANRADLERHARDFQQRTGFTYSILEAEDVIGCLYIYPATEAAYDARVTSWVRADRAEMDEIVREAVSAWLVERWPFRNPDYAGPT